MLRPLPLRLSLATLALLSLILGARISARLPAQPRVIIPPLPGDGALVLLPDGRSVLIDGGSDGAALSTWLGNTLPFGTRRIDAVVLTRADATTLPGQLAALKRYEVAVGLIPSTERATSSREAWEQLLERQGATIQTAAAGDGLALGACQLRVIAEHSGRSALGLWCGAAAVYFLESVDDELEAALTRQELQPAAAAVYPWLRSTDTRLLDQLQPRALVFGEAGDADLLLTWADRQRPGTRLLHEAIDGQIALNLDAAAVTIATAHGD